MSGIWDGPIEPFDVERLGGLDVVFLALPEDASADVVPPLLEKDVRVFDCPARSGCVTPTGAPAGITP